MTGRLARDTGAALVMVIMALALLTSLSVELLLSSASEITMAANFANQRAALYAADAIVERAMIDLGAATDWAALAGGSLRSSFVDGPPGGTRTLDDGTELDLGTIVNLAGCHKVTACSDADLDAVTADRPWGVKNPRWRLYAHGRLDSQLGEAGPRMPWYAVLMVAAYPLDNEEAISIRAEAFGPRQAHTVVEVAAERGGSDTGYNGGTTLRPLSWREVR